ncbi:MAG: DUF4398 domain-containing protein [Nevskia sp.]|nr:DUF4398 domain-containing protein [Nevskia sp.]
MIRACRTVSLAAAPLLLGACSHFHDAVKDPGADRARTELSRLEADSALSSRVPVAIREAEEAVSEAEQPRKDPELSSHLSYIADRKVQTARALAEARVAEDQLKGLGGP